MLVDAHVHIALNSLIDRQRWRPLSHAHKVEIVRKTLHKYKKNNIYGIRDGGDNFFVSKIVRGIAKEEGIIYKTPIYGLYKKGFYGGFLGKPIEDRVGFIREFHNLLQHELDHLKLIVTGIVNFRKYGDVGETTFSLRELQYMVEKAKSQGIPIMVHANGKDGVTTAIKAGADTIEHGYLIDEEVLYSMGENDTIWVPTLAPLGNILSSQDPKFEKEEEIIKKVYHEHLKNIKKAIEMGVKVALGSDAGAYGVGHGDGLLDEIKHFQGIGLDKTTVESICRKNGDEILALYRKNKG
ncbi:MAG: amidohydrolase family protein [Clostridiaceae bacterium]|nr:amidohydrolase family protein [Clostridiaceae bacterium]